MSGTCETRFPRLVDRAFVRGLPARKRRQLREHLATCDSCRTRWDRLATIDRQLAGPRLDDATLDDIAETVISTPHRHRTWWYAGAAGVVASAAIALFVLRPSPGSELAPRGDPTMGRTPGVRLFCVAGDADHVRAEARMVSVGHPPELRCTIGDDLQLAYTTPDRKGLTMVAFARLDSSMILYAPTPDGVHAMALHADRIDELIGWSTRLAAEHRPGTYDVFVRFFDREVSTLEAIDGRVSPLAELRARLEVTGLEGGDDVR
jgi:hypothetical protein